jgi:hypothetical protein
MMKGCHTMQQEKPAEGVHTAGATDDFSHHSHFGPYMGEAAKQKQAAISKGLGGAAALVPLEQ